MSWGGQLARFATNRAIILASLPLVALSQTFLLLAPVPEWFLLSLVVFGACQGVLDLFMNAEGSYVESDLGRPIFTRFHASASAAMALFAIIASLTMADAQPARTTSRLAVRWRRIHQENHPAIFFSAAC